MNAPGLRVVLCGCAGDGRRTLLAALGTDAAAAQFVASDRRAVGRFALDLLDGEPAACGVILVDAVRGIRPETRSDSRLLAALGPGDVALAVNKMDLVGFSEERFAAIEAEYRAFAATTELERVTCVPICALHGDNVCGESARLPFAQAGSLLAYLKRCRPAAPADPLQRDAPEITEADQFQATIVWIGRNPLLRGRAYELRLAGQTATATVAPVKYRLDIASGEHLAATKLETDEVGRCEIELSHAIRFAPRRVRPAAGTFALFDRISGERVGVGSIDFALRRSQNVLWQRVTVDKEARGRALGQRPTVLWLTGLSGAGKSTIANLVEAELYRRGYLTYLLDGDNVRHGLNSDLGFTPADRVENIRRVGEVTRLMVDAGLIVIVSFISPFRAERSMARGRVGPDEFIEIFVDTPLQVAEARDPKGLYRKARRGELQNFTGIDSPYEPPENPEIRIDTTVHRPEAAARHIVEMLESRGRLGRGPTREAGPPR